MNTYNVKAFGTDAPEADLKQMDIERRQVTAKDVEIDILYCGVCHSDLHTARNEWHGTVYPNYRDMRLSAGSQRWVIKCVGLRWGILRR